MEGLAVLLVILVIVSVLSGPIALIVAMMALGKSNQLADQLRRQQLHAQIQAKPAAPRPVSAPMQPPAEAKPAQVSAPRPAPAPAPHPVPAEPKPAPPPSAIPQKPQPARPQMTWPDQYTHLRQPPPKVSVPKESLEQRIGTRWILIAGIVTVLLGVTFFLKYAYDQNWLQPWTRAGIIAAGGLIALIIGEITRRRDYEIVAKGTTALGFALLYAANFAAYRVYDLIDPVPAYGIAIGITVCAMAYAVYLDEVLIAFLSLLGGYLTPILLSTGRNLPIPLFTYVLILSLGAMACAYFRRWRAVNFVAFIGTFSLYILWFEKFCRSQLSEPILKFKPVALSWLAVFFVIYLLMPLLYGFIRRAKTYKEDVVIVLLNGVVTIYYLCVMLYNQNRTQLAVGCAGMGLSYLAAMAVGLWRCREDQNLHLILLALGITFCTAAVPLYFGVHAAMLIWALEGVFLTFIGIRYQSPWTRIASVAVLACAVLRLSLRVFPLHTDTFKPFLNPAFGVWIITAAAIITAHLLWRLLKEISPEEKKLVADLLFNAGVLLAAAACAFEWYDHTAINLPAAAGQTVFFKGMLVLAAVLIFVYRVKPIPPDGDFTRFAAVMAVLLAVTFSVFALVQMHNNVFRLFANAPLAFALLPALATLASGWFTKRQVISAESVQIDLRVFTHLFLLVFLGVLLSAEVLLFWQCKDRYAGPVRDWNLYAAPLSLAVLWAVYGMVLSLAGIWSGSRKVAFLAIGSLVLAVLALCYSISAFDTKSYRLAFNPLFGAWIGVAACWIAVHIFWRWIKRKNIPERDSMVDFFYAAGVLLAAAACGLEWYRYCMIHLPQPERMTAFLEGVMVLAAGLLLLFFLRPLTPDGLFCLAAKYTLPIAAAACVVLFQFGLYHHAFRIFANPPFAFSILLTAGIFFAAWRVKRELPEGRIAEIPLSALFGLMAVVVLWLLLSMQIYLYWYCRHRYAGLLDNWAFYVSMYLSILWAVYGAVLMVLGFWRKLRALRYTALALFALLLAKTFIMDMGALKIQYRIAAYLASGLVLVMVSYLYQYAKKKGFFEAFQVKPEKQQEISS